MLNIGGVLFIFILSNSALYRDIYFGIFINVGSVNKNLIIFYDHKIISFKVGKWRELSDNFRRLISATNT